MKEKQRTATLAAHVFVVKKNGFRNNSILYNMKMLEKNTTSVDNIAVCFINSIRPIKTI